MLRLIMSKSIFFLLILDMIRGSMSSRNVVPKYFQQFDNKVYFPLRVLSSSFASLMLTAASHLNVGVNRCNNYWTLLSVERD